MNEVEKKRENSEQSILNPELVIHLKVEAHHHATTVKTDTKAHHHAGTKSSL
jgi:hypothetical protein